MLYKQHSITHKIPSGKFQTKDLIKFTERAIKIHDDCLKQLRQDLLSGEFTCSEIDPTDPAAVDNKISQNFRIIIEIFGEDGEYLNVLNLNEITSDIDLPHRFSRIRVGNCAMFEYNLKIKPSIHFEVTLDFRSTRVFDLISAPSRSTANDSNMHISGQNSTVVQGIARSIEKFFETYKSHHGFIHAENIYDLLLWLAFFPLLLAYLFKYQSAIPASVTTSPALTQVLVALTSFFIIALSFRLIFNVGRWLFPYLEIRDQTSQERMLLKAIYSIVMTAVLGAVAVHIGNFFWDALVK